MPKSFSCQHCGAAMVTYLLVGEPVRCDGCGASSLVPVHYEDVPAEAAGPITPSPPPLGDLAPDPASLVGAQPLLNPFDKLCAVLAFPIGALFIVQGLFGVFFGAQANFELSPGLGVLPFFVGWGIVRSIILAWRGRRQLAGAALQNVFE